MGRLIPADRRSTLTQITTRYNRGLQQSICEATTRTTLRRMGYTSRRPHRVPLISDVMVWGMFSWHTLGPLVPIGHRLNATAYLSIVSDHVHPFMTTMYPSSDGYFQQDNAPCHKA